MPLERIQTGSVRRKIIFVFLTFAVAFALSFLISRTAFREMMERVEKITIPDLKLKLVHQINRDLVELATSNAVDERYILALQELEHSLQELGKLYQDDRIQLARIDSIQLLAKQRDTLFRSYHTLRDRMIQNPTMQQNLQTLGQMVDHASTDSTKKVLSSNKERGFFARLFGSKRKRSNAKANSSNSSGIDPSTSDATKPYTDSIERMVEAIQIDQEDARLAYTSREAELASTDIVLINHTFQILQTVENETFLQSERENRQARQVVTESINRISAVFIIVLLAIAIMVYFILADIKKNNAYRTALESAKEEAEYHAAAKQRFLANMSHELRTPLQSIVGYAEQLKFRHPEDDPMVDAIHHSTEHLLQIVNEILDYSRINSGKIILEERAVDMREIVENLIGIMLPLARKKKLELNYSFQLDERLHLAGDPHRIRQILFNLLSNAIKFTQEGYVSLDISIRDLSGQTLSDSGPTITDKTVFLHISVADTGIGIAAENLERIFEDFEQAEQLDPNGEYRGSGLGLNIVRAISESMGGSVSVESKLGEGAVFRAILPLRVREESECDEEIPTWNFTGQVDCGEVWVIDDDRLIVQLCALILSKHNISYKVFHTPEDMLKAATSADEEGKTLPDTVLMDIRMPGMDGFQLNRSLREILGAKRVRIYAFTAQALPEEQSAILSKGFHGILLKPFRENDLTTLLGLHPRFHQNTRQDTDPISPAKPDTDADEDRIISLLIQDSLSDLESLKQYQEQEDLSKLSFTCHRLAGRIGQFGQDKLAFKLRKIEIDSRNGDATSPADFQRVVQEVETFIQEMNTSRPATT